MADLDAPGEALAAQRRRTLLALVLATAIGATGLAAGGTAGALLGTQLMGSAAAAGLPLGLLVIGSAGAALVISAYSARIGRARGLALGYAAGALGAALVVVAASVHSVGALLVGSTLLGAANAAIFLTRYAAAELGGEHARGRALGTVLAATAVGAVASPNLLGPSGTLAHAVGLPRLSGLYLVAVLVFCIAAVILGVRTVKPVEPGGAVTRRAIAAALSGRRVRVALILLAATNLVMVAVMAVAPVYLMAHGHELGVIGVVISVHVAGMFAPSSLTGRLADRAGAHVVVVLGAVLLIAAGIAGALTAADGAATAMAVLALLGVGWNCGVVGASTLLAASVAGALRPRVEGIGEAAMGLAAAAGAPLAGVVLALSSLPAVWLLTAAVATLVLPLARTASPGPGP